MTQNIRVILPEINFRNYDLSKEWYIAYKVWNPQTGKLQAIRKYVSKGATVKQRTAYINSISEQITQKLKSGWSPFSDKYIYFETPAQQPESEHGETPKNQFGLMFYLNTVHIEINKVNRNRPKTIMSYASRMKQLQTWLKTKKLETMPLAAFTKSDAQEFLQSLNVSNKTYNNYIGQFRTYFKHAIKKYGYPIQNIWMDVTTLAQNSKPRQAFSASQTELIKKYLLQYDQQLLQVIEMVYYCFVRPCSELPMLQIQHLSFEDNTLTIPAHISKNKKSQTINIPQQLMNKFIDMELWQYPIHYYIFGRTGPSETKAGRDHFSKRFTKICRELRMPKGLTIYCFKHTGNKRAHLANIPIAELRNQNRHHSLDEMQSYLTSLTASDCTNIQKNFPDL